MVLVRGVEPPDLLTATVTGTLTAGDQASLVAWVRSAIDARGPARVLLVLEKFDGWQTWHGGDQHDLWLRDDEAVTRIAIVGEARWKWPLLTAAAHPLRGIPMAYFDTEPAARRWLDTGRF